MSRRPALGLFVLLIVAALPAETPSSSGVDWPMYRFDANRSAASPQELAPTLHLQWVREYPRLKPAWPDQPLMQFDAGYEPVVAGHTLFIGSSRTDSVTALDTGTGEEKWRFYAEGPVRFAPCVWQDRVYFSADDGYLYCLDAANGSLLWKFRGGPSDRKILGNERLTSTWPARGAPVVVDGTVYFAASIWPFMGLFIHALEAKTGTPVWTNDGDGSIYIKQPHNADSFAGVAPQGPIVAVGDQLLLPGGRSVPASYDRTTGKLRHYLLAENSKRGGGSTVGAVGDVFVESGTLFDSRTGKWLGTLVPGTKNSAPLDGNKETVGAAPVAVPGCSVLTEKAIYHYEAGVCRAFRLGRDEKNKITATQVGSQKLAGVTCLIKAGPRLYAGMPNQVVAFKPPVAEGQTGLTWQAKIDGTPMTLVVADNRLFVSTLEGRIYCFGQDEVETRTHRLTAPAIPADEWTDRARVLLESTGVREGYCVAWGVGTGRLITELAKQSDLRVIAIEPDAEKARRVRELLIAANLYGERVAVHHADPLAFPLPPYLASLMVTEGLEGAGIKPDRNFIRKAFESLRPFGGVACFPLGEGEHETFMRRVSDAQLPTAVVRESEAGSLLRREGPLPETANWTHEHADAANTRVSRDQLVKAPLGLLWFGGPPNEGILPRHGHGPQPQVIDGRMIIEGVDKFRAIDIYTGRLLWETSLPGVGAFYDNLAHQPGANASSANFVSTPDGIYVAHGRHCVRLDPATGAKRGAFTLPPVGDSKDRPAWAYVNVVGDYLLGGVDPTYDPNPDKAPLSLSKLFKMGAKGSLATSKYLFVLDRHTGKALWSATAESGFRHNAICAGNGLLYCIDSRPATKADDKERGPGSRLIAFDLRTGEEVWSTTDDVFGTWLSYSEQHGILVEAGRVARDTLRDEPKGMRAYDGATGKVRWYEKNYVGPAMIHGDTILKDQSACDLLTGAPKMRSDPLTGKPVEWKWVRNYGCNTPAASEHLLTFRSGAAGYCDLCNDGGTGNFGGFRSSCTHNLVVAGGVLTAPDYTRTCTCSYQNQTSLALVHMPDAEMWTFFGPSKVEGTVKRVGVSFGAPGDRRADDGTLWLEAPSVGGASPSLDVKVAGKALDYFRHHASRIEGEMPWVCASGVKGAETITIGLGPQNAPERTYTVRLFFAEPDNLHEGERVFDVSLQKKKVLDDLDVVKEAGGVNRSLVKEFKNVRVRSTLELTLIPEAGVKERRSILCGVQVLAAETTAGSRPAARPEREVCRGPAQPGNDGSGVASSSSIRGIPSSRSCFCIRHSSYRRTCPTTSSPMTCSNRLNSSVSSLVQTTASWFNCRI